MMNESSRYCVERGPHAGSLSRTTSQQPVKFLEPLKQHNRCKRDGSNDEIASAASQPTAGQNVVSRERQILVHVSAPVSSIGVALARCDEQLGLCQPIPISCHTQTFA